MFQSCTNLGDTLTGLMVTKQEPHLGMEKKGTQEEEVPNAVLFLRSAGCSKHSMAFWENHAAFKYVNVPSNHATHFEKTFPNSVFGLKKILTVNNSVKHREESISAKCFSHLNGCFAGVTLDRRLSETAPDSLSRGIDKDLGSFFVVHHLTGKPEGESGRHESSRHGKDDEDREESERRRRKGKTLAWFLLVGVIRNWLCCVLNLATVDQCLSPQKIGSRNPYRCW